MCLIAIWWSTTRQTAGLLRLTLPPVSGYHVRLGCLSSKGVLRFSVHSVILRRASHACSPQTRILEGHGARTPQWIERSSLRSTSLRNDQNKHVQRSILLSVPGSLCSAFYQVNSCIWSGQRKSLSHWLSTVRSNQLPVRLTGTVDPGVAAPAK